MVVDWEDATFQGLQSLYLVGAARTQ